MVSLRILRWIFYVLFAAILWGYVTGSGTLLPEIHKINNIVSTSVEKIDRFINLSQAVKGRVISQQNLYVFLEDIPLTLHQAIIATEDARFYRHHGVDFEGIARALFINLQDRQFSEGGSTITQQLAKNLFLSQEKTLTRKAEEIVLAVGIEMRFTKEEILEMYLNQIYYGSGAYGIGSAADIYFGKKVKQLTLAECTILAGLPQAPSAYSPYVNFQAAKQRQAAVLDAMVKQGFISSSVAEKTKKEPIYLAR
jgi:penicillin-binding protein 1A